ncbi:unnamed protein product, partial [Rotaria socialis]
QLLDQQYCLEKDRQLWQSYLDIGLQQHLWPDQFYTMSKANDFDLCKQYVMNYTENNKKQLNHCQFELTKQEQQFQTCPMIELSFEQMEQRLQELVDRERKYLSKRNNDKLIKFKDDISEEKTIDNDIHVFFYEQSTKYEQQYQNEFIQLESLFSNNNGIINDTTMLNNIKEYINNRINRLNKCGNLGLKSECCVLQKNEAGGRLVSIKLPKTIHP